MSLHDKDIFIETEALAPLLVSLERNAGFQTPDGYFNTLQQTIEQQALPLAFDQTHLLADSKSTYFAELESNILAQAAAEETGNTPRSIQRTRMVRFAAFATGIAATMTVLWFIDAQQQTPCNSFECMLSSYAISEADMHNLEAETWEIDIEDQKASLFTHLDDEVLTAYILEVNDNEWMLSELMND